MYQPERWAEKERDLAEFADRVRLLRVEGEGRAYGLGSGSTGLLRRDTKRTGSPQ
jgi:hypothetical protein